MENTLRMALLRAFYEMDGDYVDESWNRDLQYIADALGLDLLAMQRARYDRPLDLFIADMTA